MPGDPPNLVDWRTFARHADRDDAPLLVKTFDAEQANRTTVVVDASASMDIYPQEEKLATALGTAALLAAVALEHGDPVELVLFGAGGDASLYESALLRSPPDLDRAAEEIEARPGPAGAAAWGLLVDPYAGLKGSRQTLVLVSDFFADLGDVARVLGGLRPDVRTFLAVRVHAPSDFNPFPASGDVEVYDVEAPGHRRQVAPDLAAYQRRLEAHLLETDELLAGEGVLAANVEAVAAGRLDPAASRRQVVEALLAGWLLEPV